MSMGIVAHRKSAASSAAGISRCRFARRHRRIVVFRRAVHAGLFGIRLEAPGWIGVNDVIELRSEFLGCDLRCLREFDFAGGSAGFFGGGLGGDFFAGLGSSNDRGLNLRRSFASASSSSPLSSDVPMTSSIWGMCLARVASCSIEALLRAVLAAVSSEKDPKFGSFFPADLANGSVLRLRV